MSVTVEELQKKQAGKSISVTAAGYHQGNFNSEFSSFSNLQTTPPVPKSSAQHSSLLIFLYSNLVSILPEPIIGLIQEYSVAKEEITVFLKLVAEGEQDKAEAMLKSNPALALVRGDVTDLSKRTFTDITAFQYALWALDWHMWTMLLKYIPAEAVTEQIVQSEGGLWVPQHGVTANWENLTQALNQYVSEVDSKKPYDVYKQTWIKQVGGAQLLLPVHVINEYCHPAQRFDPVPDFSKPEASRAWRRRTTEEGDWFSAKYQGGTLGEGFAVYRGDSSYAMRTTPNDLYLWGGPASGAKRDSAAVAALLKTRVSQRAALIAQHLPKQEPARKIAQGRNAGHS